MYVHGTLTTYAYKGAFVIKVPEQTKFVFLVPILSRVSLGINILVSIWLFMHELSAHQRSNIDTNLF